MNQTRDVYDEAVVAYLATATNKNIGYVVAPEDRTLPYAVLHPVGGTGDQGAWADPAEDASLVFQVTSVGGSPKQAQWMASQINQAFMDLDSEITVTSGSVQGRSTDTLGPVTPSGEDLYNVTDIYRARVGE